MEVKYNQITWSHINNPQLDDLSFLQKELKISPSIMKDLLSFNKRPKIEEFDNYLFLAIHFPVFDPATRKTEATELDFVITDHSIITIFQKPNPALENLFKELADNPDGQAEHFKSTGWLLFFILNHLIDSCLPMLDHILEKINEIEERVFEGREKEMLREIAIVKRDIIDFRSTIKPQRSVLEILAKKVNRFFKLDLDIISQEVIGSEVRVWNTLENHKEMIEAIESTNHSLLSFQINQVMHTLTFFSIILFSLTFIAGFFSMKVFEHPLFTQPLSLLVVSGVMIVDILIITWLFKRKNWL